MKARVFNFKLLIIVALLVTGIFQAAQVFGQEKKAGREGTVKIRIEKQKNGKTEVIEKVYKADEWPGNIPSDVFFHFPGSIKDLDASFQMRFDTAFSKLHRPDMSFYFNADDSSFFQNHFSFQKGMDSLLKKHEQLMYKFDFELKPSLDSMMDDLMSRQNDFHFQFEEKFRLDSMMDKHREKLENFKFDWSDSFDSTDFNLMLDKDLYNVEETEDANGNKMIKITPKKEPKDKASKNSESRMQPSSAPLYLSYDPASGRAVVSFNLPEKGNTVVSIINSQGKEVYKEKLKNFSGSYKKEIDLRKKGTGDFTIQVSQNSTLISKKLNIQ